MKKRVAIVVSVLLIALLVMQTSALASCPQCFNGENEWYFICNRQKTPNGSDTHIVWFKPLIDTCTRSIFTSTCKAYCRYCDGVTSLRYMDHLCCREHSYCVPSYESLCQYPD